MKNVRGFLVRLGLVLGASIIISEAAIMLLFSVFNVERHFGGVYAAMIDSALLILCIAAPIYLWVIKPLRETIGHAAERNALLVAAIEHSRQGFMVVDRKGRIEYYNSGFSESTSEALDSEEITALFPEAASPLWRKTFISAIRLHGEWRTEREEPRKDATPVWITYQVLPLFLKPSGKISHFLIMRRDETTLHELQDSLSQAQKIDAMGTLVGGVAHDFNNKLAAITGHLYLAAANVQDKERRHIEIANQVCFEASDIVRNLLTFARRGNFDESTFSLTALIKESIRKHTIAIPENIRIEQNITNEPLYIKANPTQIEQSFLNLINNARDALEERIDPVLSIELAPSVPARHLLQSHPFLKHGSYATLTIRDNGIGMNKQTEAQIFDPFYTTKPVGKGTGLGLSTTLGMARSIDGDIVVSSQPSVGSSFTIYLPIVKAPISIPTDFEKSDDYPKGNMELILLADDDLTLLEATGEILTKLNYEVIKAKDGRKAVELFKLHRNRIRLVMMDLVMPNMGGVGALMAMRTISPDVKAVLMTGYDSHGSLSFARKEAIALINKPFTINELASTIKMAIDSPLKDR